MNHSKKPTLLQTRVEHLRVVHDMLTTMGLSELQANTVLHLFCSDIKISDDTREQLINLYKDSLTLEPFTIEAVVPIEGITDVMKTSRKEKNTFPFLRPVVSARYKQNQTTRLCAGKGRDRNKHKLSRFFVEEMTQQVKWQLAFLATGVDPCVPPLNIVVGAHVLLKDRPVFWRERSPVDPRILNV